MHLSDNSATRCSTWQDSFITGFQEEVISLVPLLWKSRYRVGACSPTQLVKNKRLTQTQKILLLPHGGTALSLWCMVSPFVHPGWKLNVHAPGEAADHSSFVDLFTEALDWHVSAPKRSWESEKKVSPPLPPQRSKENFSRSKGKEKESSRGRLVPRHCYFYFTHNIEVSGEKLTLKASNEKLNVCAKLVEEYW